ncbi:hypothetical protein AVEN_258223-1 [Araneus ventricosus]|uniref:Uncharacterized protein n=1 Tax=Araneus ventricosus TaxID=182803 RepID=A0A4Y2USI0_ARAVE|nr:hypothetical protein AVEN_258223-1 [Araneus ventricosus]
MNYIPVSLKDMAIRRMATVLFKESTILASISNMHTRSRSFINYEGEWRETVEDKLPDEVSKLGLPKSLTKLLIDTVKLMCRQVGKWKEFHEEYLQDSLDEDIYFDIAILEKLCWTAAGAVDYGKTAKELVRSDVIDTVKKFKLACLYCLEDFIPLFWQELPNENKKYFCNKRRHRLEIGPLGLQFWWPYIINGQESKLEDLIRSYRGDQITLHQYAFQCSLKRGNKTAAEYFFQKLTLEEKEASLMSSTRVLLGSRISYWYNVFPREQFSELLIYLLSVMTPDQQMQIFEERPLVVLSGLLQWPFQDIFSEIADLIWNFLPEREYDSVLQKIYCGFRHSREYFLRLFQELFLRIPRDSWNSFVDRECESGSYFELILRKEDIEAIELFFRRVGAATRARLVFSEPALRMFTRYIKIGKWDVMEVCLREARLSQEDRERLKEVFTRHLTSIGVREMKRKTRKWSRFFQLLDEPNDPSKRFSEDETPTEAKKRKN